MDNDAAITRRFTSADGERMQKRIAAIEESERGLRELCQQLVNAIDRIEADTYDPPMQEIARDALSLAAAVGIEVK